MSVMYKLGQFLDYLIENIGFCFAIWHLNQPQSGTLFDYKSNFYLGIKIVKSWLKSQIIGPKCLICFNFARFDFYSTYLIKHMINCFG